MLNDINLSVMQLKPQPPNNTASYLKIVIHSVLLVHPLY